MHDTIQANYEGLEAISGRFGQQEAMVDQMLQQVISAVEKLQGGGWIGHGSNAFFAEMSDNVVPGVRRLGLALAEASLVTQQIAALLQDADEQASAPFQDGAAGGGGYGASIGAGSAGWGGVGNILNGLPGMPGSSFLGEPSTGGSNSGFWGDGSYNPSIVGNGIFDQLLDESGFGASGDWSQLGQSGLEGWGSTTSNDWGIPQDWLSGVTDAIFGNGTGRLPDFIIPQDWLEDIKDFFGLDDGSSPSGEMGVLPGDLPASNNSLGAGVGGGMGASADGGGIGAGDESPITASDGLSGAMDDLTSDASTGPSTDRLQGEPTSRDENLGGSNSGIPSSGGSNMEGSRGAVPHGGTHGGTGSAGYQPSVGAADGTGGTEGTRVGPLGYQPMGITSTAIDASHSAAGGQSHSTGRSTVAPSPQNSGAGQGGFGIPVGLAAITPFAALLGKMLKEKRDK